MSFANDILDAIEIMVKQVVEDNTTKIYTGVCKTIGVNNCVLTINGKDNTVKYYGGVPVVGTVYQVFIPFGNMSAAFIIVPGSGGGSGGSGVDSVNGKTGDVVLNAADIGALPNTTTIPSKTSQLTNDSGYITVSGAPVKSVDGETGDVTTNAIKTTQQNLSDTQKAQARTNIGAGTSSFDGNYSSLNGKPIIPSNTSQLNNDSGFITSENAPVKSVNGKTGDVVLTATDVGGLPTSGGTLTGNLTVGSASINTNGYVVGTWLQGTATNHLTNAATKIAVQDGSGWVYHRTAEEIKSDIGLSNVDNVKQYSASNPPPYPVTSVNGQTGDVIVSANQFKPAGKSYLTFSSPNSFTLAVGDATKHWDGTLEYFASDKTWTVWDGNTTLSAVDNDGEYVLYLRGTGNTVITGNSQNYKWVLTGSDIKCIGDIENLLDYETVESGAHPTMATHCYNSMFSGCTSLTQAPTLPATTLEESCYRFMFRGCIGLTQAPALPATTLADYCYFSIFQGCTGLTQAPALPATTLAAYCYSYMFRDCTSLTQAPTLPATTLVAYCYSSMFYNCTNLIQAPALPATTLADYCYLYMFSGCTSLTQAPALPATTLATKCYQYMFYGCTSLTRIPALPAITLAESCYNSMFHNCTGLKLSTTQTEEYTIAYCIPSSGTGTTATDALTDMFTSTGGTFTGTPEINTTYYLSSDNMVVRETEIATLNGYVSSMIDAAIGDAEAVQSNLDDHTGNTTVHITAAERTTWNGKSGKAVSFTVTLTVAGWSGNTQNVSNSKFVTSGYAYTVCPAGDSFAGYAEAVIYADDVTTAGKMTFHCSEKPTANLTVNILRTEATA